MECACGTFHGKSPACNPVPGQLHPPGGYYKQPYFGYKRKITFLHKDYAKHTKVAPIALEGVEFLRRFCMHILPKRFIKIRRFGVYSSRYKAVTQKLKPKTIDTLLRNKESMTERLTRVTGFDVTLCPVCKSGKLHRIAELPKIRSPTGFYATVLNIA